MIFVVDLGNEKHERKRKNFGFRYSERCEFRNCFEGHQRPRRNVSACETAAKGDQITEP